jgi:hypothetical protein
VTRLRLALFIASTAALWLAAASPAAACKGPTTLFTDDFREIDESWGVEGDSVTVDEGRVVIKADPNTMYKLLYSGTNFENMDYCVTVRMPNNTPEDSRGSMAGIIFWAQDYSNLFAFEISVDGRVALERLTKGKWTNVLDWRKVNGINTGSAAKNVLDVNASGNTLTLSVNDMKVGSLKASRPEAGGQIGLIGQSEKGKRNAWKFLQLKVTNVAP